jgi:hypothetical protein
MINIINTLVCATLYERLWDADIWYSLPAIIAISLVYAATLHHAFRTGLWIAGFMAVFFLLLGWIT